MQRAARDLSGALAIWLCLAPLAAAQYSYYQPVAPSTTPYEAWLADGTRIAGTRFGGWFKSGTDQPLLDGQTLKLHGRPDNPLRLLRQQAVAMPRLTPPYVELANGDILPGRVISAEIAGNDADDVRLTVSVDTTLTVGGFSTGRVTVRGGWVARIVGSPRALAPAPANVALGLDGEQIPYRSFRWMPEGVRLLTDKGVQVVPFGSLGQIVPPGVDRIAALLAEAAQANAEGASFLMRAVTRQGAVLTTTRTECETQKRVTRGGIRDYRPQPDIQIEYVQPAWSLNTLSVQVNDVLLRGFRTPHDIPLSLLPLETVKQRSLVGVPHTRAPNAAGDGGWLTAGDRVADLGLAVRSRTVLRATLPPGAKTLSGWVGLDRSVGAGGCIVAEIYDGVPNGNPLWSSGFLQGKDGPRRIDALPIDDLSHLTLVTDFGHEGRPAGADPLDIRDEATWLAPMVQVADVVLEASQRWRGLVPGWQGWTLPEEMPRELLLTTRFATFDGRWESVVDIGEESPLVLKRRVQVGAFASDILELQIAAMISSPGYSDPSRLHNCELRVGDTVLAPLMNGEKLRSPEEILRTRTFQRGFGYPSQVNPMGTLAVWWDLQDYRGREVELTLTIRRPANREMLWRDLRFRAAVGQLRPGQPLQPDVPLSAVKPLARFGESGYEIDALPDSREPLTIVGQLFKKGLGMSREARVSFPLQAEFKRFVALVGAARNRAGPFRVLIDGEQVWSQGTVESVVSGREVVVDIPAGAKVLSLETGDGSYTGFAVWANAGFMTK